MTILAGLNHQSSNMNGTTKILEQDKWYKAGWDDAIKEIKNMKLTEQEKWIISNLLKSEKETIRFLTGFGKESDNEVRRKRFLDDLITKIENDH